MPRSTSDEALPLEGLPQPPVPDPCAGDLVAAWCSSYTDAHAGTQPDPSVVRRVAGICRQVAKDRTDLDSWRDAWRACKTAGARGRFDVIGELAAPAATTASSGRGNHYLGLVTGASTATSSSAPRIFGSLG